MKRCIITGGNSGIGFATVKEMVNRGYHVTMICRNEDRAINAIHRLEAHNQVDYMIVDLAKVNDVITVIQDYVKTIDKIDVLINNAADFDLSNTEPIYYDGLEKQFATNVAAPYVLSNLFLDALRNSGKGRVLNISSKGLCVFPFMKLDLDNLDANKYYRPSIMYYQNKLALLMMSLWMRKTHPDIKIQAIRVPNVKIDMSRYDNLPTFMKKAYALKAKFSITPEEMAKVYATLANDEGYEGFLYDEKCKEVKANRSAYDEEAQEILIQYLKEKTGI